MGGANPPGVSGGRYLTRRFGKSGHRLGVEWGGSRRLGGGVIGVGDLVMVPMVVGHLAHGRIVSISCVSVQTRVKVPAEIRIVMMMRREGVRLHSQQAQEPQQRNDQLHSRFGLFDDFSAVKFHGLIRVHPKIELRTAGTVFVLGFFGGTENLFNVGHRHSGFDLGGGFDGGLRLRCLGGGSFRGRLRGGRLRLTPDEHKPSQQ